MFYCIFKFNRIIMVILQKVAPFRFCLTAATIEISWFLWQQSVIGGDSRSAVRRQQVSKHVRNADRNSLPGDNPFFSRKWRHAIGRNWFDRNRCDESAGWPAKFSGTKEHLAVRRWCGDTSSRCGCRHAVMVFVNLENAKPEAHSRAVWVKHSVTCQ